MDMFARIPMLQVLGLSLGLGLMSPGCSSPGSLEDDSGYYPSRDAGIADGGRGQGDAGGDDGSVGGDGISQLCPTISPSVSLDCSRNEFQVSNGSSYAFEPTVGLSPTGRALILWRESDGYQDFGEIRARVYNGVSESFNGSSFSANSDNQSRRPQVVPLNDGSFLVTWLQSIDGTLIREQMWKRRFSSSGEPMGSASLVTGSELAFDVGGAGRGGIAFRRDGSYVLTHYENTDLYVQVYDVNGEPVSASTLLASHSDYDNSFEHQLVLGAMGEFAALWQLWGDPWSVYHRRFDQGGEPISETATIHPGGASQVRASAAVILGGGRLLYVYQSAGSEHGFFQRSFGPDGALLGSGQFLFDDEFAIFVSMGAATDGRSTLLGWNGYVGGNGNLLMAAILNEDGGVMVNPFRVNVQNDNSLKEISVGQDQDGSLMAVWSRAGSIASGDTTPRIFGRAFRLER